MNLQPDPVRSGEEAADNARVWKIYRDRMSERDQVTVDGWNKTLDILLIFVGNLFLNMFRH